MKNVSIKGLVIAMVITLGIDMVGGLAAIPIFASDFTEETLEALFYQSEVLIYVLIIGTMSSFIGGYICARYAQIAPFKNALIFGAVGIALSLVMAPFDPAWVDIIGCILIIPAVLLGAQLVAKKNA